jgi:anhydro-N-acetylmuramic acid kinase
MADQIFRTIGLMSGTSADGVDAAYLETDGRGYVNRGEGIALPYAPDIRRRILAAMGKPDDPTLPELEQDITELHAQAVDILLTQMDKKPEEIDLLGFHGQTIFHDPANRKTLQIGDGARLATHTGIDVVNDFRTADVAAGGQGAPLVPLYHAAIAAEWAKPGAIVNIGGVANVTYLGPGDVIIACDIGPGNALMDDAMQTFFGLPCDVDGGIAAMGAVNEKLLNEWLADEFFAAPAPKSLDRNHFKNKINVDDLMPDEALATLAEFTARSIIKSAELFPAPPKQWIITGGGRKNQHLMTRLRALSGASVHDISDMKCDGDALEAQAFGYLAARHKLGLPLSLPTTTGVPAPMPGGKFYAAKESG